ncbi:MAG: acyl-CoA dehydrogenase family protein [Rhodothalassiaceae bacterium]
MADDRPQLSTGPAEDLSGFLEALGRANVAALRLIEAITADMRLRLGGTKPGREDRTRHQDRLHGLSWFATYAATLAQTEAHLRRLAADGRAGEIDHLAAVLGCGNYLAQMAGGIAMSQTEFARLREYDIDPDLLADFARAAEPIIRGGHDVGRKQNFAALLAHGQFPEDGLDETLSLVRETFRRVADRYRDAAQDWHQADRLIPLAVIDELSQMGVFGLTLPESHGGAGMGKQAMCVVSEELSRGYIGLGSLGTRAEIAAELIHGSGTREQQARFLPGLASGAILPTAVFTEPEAGSDLASLRTRAVRDGDVYRVSGAKTWITHAARADLMTMLVRTGAPDSGHGGLSILLAEKPRGSENDPFPAPGMSGSEIKVLGYRGMKEYELAFDNFEVPARNLLGDVEGEGFRQLMKTFESARIQTAARALGVARAAFELALDYAMVRHQFGRPILDFPRVHGKIAAMASEIMMVRCLCYHAASAKDGGRRSDLEAGMAKLLAARLAWSAADNAVQIHGGNGYALEYPISRILVDARILNIFEGAAEIQADVIASRLLAGEADGRA